MAYLQAGRIKDSLEALQKILRLDENFAAAHYHLALALRLDGREQDAEQHLEKARALGYPVAEAAAGEGV